MSKVGISCVISSSMILLFGGMMLLYPSGSSEMRQIRVGMTCQPLIMTSPLYDISSPVPYRNTSKPASTRIYVDMRLFVV